MPHAAASVNPLVVRWAPSYRPSMAIELNQPALRHARAQKLLDLIDDEE